MKIKKSVKVLIVITTIVLLLLDLIKTKRKNAELVGQRSALDEDNNKLLRENKKLAIALGKTIANR